MTEILKTLQEADKRFEMNKEYLSGGKQQAQLFQNEEIKSQRTAQAKRSLFDNIPPGMTVSKLEYPVYVDGKISMSTVILLGVK